MPSVRAGARWNRYKKETNQLVTKNVEKPNQVVEKILFLNFQKNENMTQARKEGKEAVGSLRSNLRNTRPSKFL